MSKGFEESKYGYLRYMSLKSLVERDNLPGFLSSYLTKKKLTFEKSFAADFFWSEFRKKNVIKKVETDIRWDIFLIIYAFPLQKQQGRRVTAFFWYAFWKSQAQNETIWAWDFTKLDVMPTDGLVVMFTKGCVKGSAGLCKGGVHCAARCPPLSQGMSPGGCSWCEIFTDEIIRSSQPLMVLLEEGSCSRMKWLPRAQNTWAHFDSRERSTF